MALLHHLIDFVADKHGLLWLGSCVYELWGFPTFAPSKKAFSVFFSCQAHYGVCKRDNRLSGPVVFLKFDLLRAWKIIWEIEHVSEIGPSK